MNEHIKKALEQTSDHYIYEASVYNRARLPRRYAVIAAVLAVAILIGSFIPWQHMPFVGQFVPLATPVYPKMVPYSGVGASHEKWMDCIREQYDQPKGYADSLDNFFTESIAQFLGTADDENAVCSPVNIYMALALLAECAEGESRQQILDLMELDSIEELRVQAGHVWNAHYRDDKLVKLLMSNSLWLDSDFSYQQETADTLASSYYASAYRTDLGSSIGNQMLRSWLNKETGGLLKDQTAGLELDPGTVLALASTIQYKADWMEKFDKNDNKEGIFYGAVKDTIVTYMTQTAEFDYYWSEKFTAVTLPLKDGSKMWLILPDRGFTPETLLEERIALKMAMGSMDNVEVEREQIRVIMPKFDIYSEADMVSTVKKLGVTDIFSPAKANFNGICPGESGLYINKITHNTRLNVDEYGVIGVAYTVSSGLLGGPPSPNMRFTLDRPFLFVVTSLNGLPLFTGVVNSLD